MRRFESYQEKKRLYEAEFERISKKTKPLRILKHTWIRPNKQRNDIIYSDRWRRFKSSNHYLSYCGLVKHEKLSGGRSYGRRLPRYSRRLKGVYVSAAVRVASTENPRENIMNICLTKRSCLYIMRRMLLRDI